MAYEYINKTGNRTAEEQILQNQADIKAMKTGVITGLEGPHGPQGIVGPKGEQGIIGPQGAQGIQGVQGQQGIEGPIGIRGQQGIQGVHGPQGIQGNVGLTGPQGVIGNTGLKGDQGIQGADAILIPGKSRESSEDLILGGHSLNLNLLNGGSYSGRYNIVAALSEGVANYGFKLYVDGILQAERLSILDSILLRTIGLSTILIMFYNEVGESTYYVNAGTAQLIVNHPSPFKIEEILNGSLVGPKGEQGIQGLRGEQGIQGIQGNTGSKGEQGIQGDIGVTGPKGDTGNDGIQGLQGVQGEQGIQGLTGPQGITGDVGPQGVQGIQGTQGIKGVQGFQGEQGNKGDTGYTPYIGLNNNWWIGNTDTGYSAKGSKGDKGDKGDRGEVGSQGLLGPQGLRGLTGPQGSQGIQGNTGDKGDKGDNGKSFEITRTVSEVALLPEPTSMLTGVAYAVGLIAPYNIYLCVFNGDSDYVWQNQGAIQGPQGVQGIQGIQGNAGPRGEQGIQGIQGEQGLAGLKGDQGIAALLNVGTVETSTSGSDAQVTESGTAQERIFNFVIPRGIQGVQGEQGIQGIQGVTGEQGEKGDQGIQGIQGVAGAGLGITGGGSPMTFSGSSLVTGSRNLTGLAVKVGSGTNTHSVHFNKWIYRDFNFNFEVISGSGTTEFTVNIVFTTFGATVTFTRNNYFNNYNLLPYALTGNA